MLVVANILTGVAIVLLVVLLVLQLIDRRDDWYDTDDPYDEEN